MYKNQEEDLTSDEEKKPLEEKPEEENKEEKVDDGELETPSAV